jgi:gamma-glutamyltranspeptidase/glutathione hydrolase
MRPFVLLLAAAIVCAPTAAQSPSETPFWRPVVMGTFGMVAAEHPLESMAGWQVLDAGGNAFDAAAAVFYMTTVVEQHQAGMGGDLFMVAYVAEEDRVVFINGTGGAPALATAEYFREQGGIPSAGPDATDVPGAVGGVDLALQTFGTMTYGEVLAPAIRAAREGHPLDFWSSTYHQRNVEKISPYPSSVEVLMPEGRALDRGDVFVQADLARSMELIASGGVDVFYRGELARRFGDFYEEMGGRLRYEDLAAYEAELSGPIVTEYRGVEVYQRRWATTRPRTYTWSRSR